MCSPNKFQVMLLNSEIVNGKSVLQTVNRSIQESFKTVKDNLKSSVLVLILK